MADKMSTLERDWNESRRDETQETTLTEKEVTWANCGQYLGAIFLLYALLLSYFLILAATVMFLRHNGRANCIARHCRPNKPAVEAEESAAEMWTHERKQSNLSSEMLAHFANFKLAGDRFVRDTAEALSTASASAPSLGRTQRRDPTRLSRKRRRSAARRGGIRSTRRVHALSDADLEAELAQRRAIRNKERDKYARAMRSEKLSLLETELMRLRSEISRIDRGLPPSASTPAVGAGTPPHPRWESLDGKGARAPSLNSSAVPKRAGGGSAGSGGGGGGPPPPPPMSGLRMPGDDDEEIDPERQKREKAERQRRREMKKKERMAVKKPLTIADIILSAGPNPLARLKPKGSTAIPDVNDPEQELVDEVAKMKDSLKKTEKKPKDVKEDGRDGDTKEDGRKEDEKKDRESHEHQKEIKDENKDAKPDEKEGDTSAAVNNPPDVTKSDKAAKNLKSNDASKNSEDASTAPEVKPSENAPAAASSTLTASAVPAVPKTMPPPPPPATVPAPPTPLVANGRSTRKVSDVDALASVAALAAKLPQRKVSDGAAAPPPPPPPAGAQQRLTMAEKRKMRREAKEREEAEQAGHLPS